METSSVTKSVAVFPSARSPFNVLRNLFGPLWARLLKDGILGLVLAASVLVAVVLRVLWIADIPYIADEPNLILAALDNNQAGTWAQKGLQGAKGVHYGPLVTWIYQLGVRFFASPLDLALAKTLLISFVTIFCLAVWSKHLTKSGPKLVFLALLSPFLWFYSRDLWDNSWAIPLSLVLWTSYLAFDLKPSLRRLLLPTVSGAALFLVHLMSTPILAAVTVHFLIKHRLWIRRRWAGVIALALLAVAIDIRYILQLVQIHTTSPPGAWSLKSMAFVLRAPLYFATWDFTYFLGRNWMDIPAYGTLVRLVIRMGTLLSLLSYAFFALGIVLAFRRPKRALKIGSPGSYPAEIMEWRTESDALALLTVGIYAVLATVKGLSDHPHYFNGIWPAVFYLIWRGLDQCWSARGWVGTSWAGASRALVGIWGVSCVGVLVALAVRIHMGEGTRSLHYGPTLGNLNAVTETLVRMAGVEVVPAATHPRFFPQGVESILRWKWAHGGVEQATPETKRWLINYRYPKQYWHGGLVVEPLEDTKAGLRKVPASGS